VTYRLDKPFELPPFTPHVRYPAGKSFHYAIDPASYADWGELGVRTHFVGLDKHAEQEWQVLLADTPSLLRGGLLGSPLTETLKRPSLLLRHEGADPLSTVFIAVHEPYYRAPKIKSVRRLKTAEADTAVVALEIAMSNRTDTVLLALDGDAVTSSAPSAIALRGQLAVVERIGVGQPSAWMVGGTSLSAGRVLVETKVATYTGTIEAVRSIWNGDAENAFITSAELPEGQSLNGRWMIVRHGEAIDEGYQIDRVGRRDGKMVVHLMHDPGLVAGAQGGREIFFPRRRWTGTSQFTLPTQASQIPKY
jgi:hypothetical protein